MLEKRDLLASINLLSLADVEQRLADVDAERAALSLLRRSLAARERVKRRQLPGGHVAQAAAAEKTN